MDVSKRHTLHTKRKSRRKRVCYHFLIEKHFHNLYEVENFVFCLLVNHSRHSSEKVYHYYSMKKQNKESLDVFLIISVQLRLLETAIEYSSFFLVLISNNSEMYNLSHFVALVQLMRWIECYFIFDSLELSE